MDEKALNPAQRSHRWLTFGFPRIAFDRAQGRTGSLLMVRCGSIGCYAMTMPSWMDLAHFVTAALRNGQQRFQVQVFPFRMTNRNLRRRHEAGPATCPFSARSSRRTPIFSKKIFLPPKVSVCEGRFAFERTSAADGSTPIDAECPQPKH